MREPLAGVLDLRGTPLPVLDMRTAEGRGDVLVLGTEDGDVIGVAVDSVTAVRGPAEFAASADGAPPRGLPGYVVEVLYDLATGAAVLRVDVHRMLAVIG
jgi:chemotaxis signal transduction protein